MCTCVCRATDTRLICFCDVPYRAVARVLYWPGVDMMVPAFVGVQDGVNPYSAEKHAMQEGIPCLRKLPKLELDMEAQNEYFEGAPRTNRMFFSGAINTKANIEPSRYEAYMHLRNKTGFKMVQTEKELSMVHKWEVSEPIDSLTEMSKSDFCMVPLGKTGNYGQRDVPSAAVGCLPVFTKFLVADQSLRPSLQWGASSVRLPPPSVRWLEAVMDTYTKVRIHWIMEVARAFRLSAVQARPSAVRLTLACS